MRWFGSRLGTNRHLGTPLPISSREWDLYRTFLSVGLLENVDLITADLSISIPTLRRRIARLEGLHGRKLCRNTGSRFSLTRDGQALLNSLRSADEIIADLNQLTERSGQAPREVLQVRSTRHLLEDFWLPLAQSSRSMFDDMRLRLATLEGAEDEGRSGMVVSVAPRLRIAALDDVEMVGTAYSYFGAYPSYADSHGTPRLQELGKHVFIRSECMSSDPDFWDEILEIERRCRRSIQVEHYPTAHRLAQAGLGFTVCTSFGHTTANDVEPFLHLGRQQVPVFAAFHGKAWRGQRGVNLREDLLRRLKGYFRLSVQADGGV